MRKNKRKFADEEKKQEEKKDEPHAEDPLRRVDEIMEFLDSRSYGVPDRERRTKAKHKLSRTSEAKKQRLRRKRERVIRERSRNMARVMFMEWMLQEEDRRRAGAKRVPEPTEEDGPILICDVTEDESSESDAAPVSKKQKTVCPFVDLEAEQDHCAVVEVEPGEETTKPNARVRFNVLNVGMGRGGSAGVLATLPPVKLEAPEPEAPPVEAAAKPKRKYTPRKPKDPNAPKRKYTPRKPKDPNAPKRKYTPRKPKDAVVAAAGSEDDTPLSMPPKVKKIKVVDDEAECGDGKTFTTLPVVKVEKNDHESDAEVGYDSDDSVWEEIFSCLEVKK